MDKPADGSLDKDIRREPAIQNLLARMPNAVAESFTDKQLIHLKTAIGSRNWGKHPIDLRGTLTFPFARSHIYYVILFGKNRRSLSDRERKASAFAFALLVLMLIFGGLVIAFLMLYLAKSFVGIDLFPGFSLGIWDYFRDNFLSP